MSLDEDFPNLKYHELTESDRHLIHKALSEYWYVRYKQSGDIFNDDSVQAKRLSDKLFRIVVVERNVRRDTEIREAIEMLSKEAGWIGTNGENMRERMVSVKDLLVALGYEKEVM